MAEVKRPRGRVANPTEAGLPSSNNIALLDDYLTDYLLERCCKENKIYQALHRNILIRRALEDSIPEGSYDYVLIDSQPSYSLLSTSAIL